jgi:predicted DNA-binding transcriptional regulator AlpA
MATMRRPPMPVQPSSEAQPGDERAVPLLLTARQAATACGRSLRTWRTWDALGLVPQPVRIGRNTLWRAGELREWVAASCPRRADWEARS